MAAENALAKAKHGISMAHSLPRAAKWMIEAA